MRTHSTQLTHGDAITIMSTLPGCEASTRTMENLAGHPCHEARDCGERREHESYDSSSSTSWQEWLCNSSSCSMEEHNESCFSSLEEIKVALKALEDMRLHNLEVELLQNRGIVLPTVNETVNNNVSNGEKLWRKCCCTTCMLSGHGHYGYTTNELKLKLQGVFVKPCVTCGAPTCPNHVADLKLSSNKDVAAQNPICIECGRLFTLHFVMDVLTSPASLRPTLISRIMAAYDRALLLFQLYYIHYNSAYDEDCEQLAEAVHESQIHRHQLIIGGSSAGVLSGALGIVAAATVSVPVVGTPLLIASLILGGGAAAVQTTSHILHQHHFEPRQRACHILSLHQLLQSILKVIQVLRDALVHDQIRTQSPNLLVDEEPLTKLELDRHQQALINGFTIGRCTLAGVELATATADAGGMAGASLVADVLPAANLARLAGGALSAATVVVEAHVLTSNLQALQRGSPCAIAEALRTLSGRFPTTKRLNAECQVYLDALSKRERAMTELEVKCILMELADKQVKESTNDDRNNESLPVEHDDSKRVQRRSRRSSLPLRQRIERYAKERSPCNGSVSLDETSTSSWSEEDGSSSSSSVDDDVQSVSSIASSCSSSKLSLLERIERHKKWSEQAASSPKILNR